MVTLAVPVIPGPSCCSVIVTPVKLAFPPDQLPDSDEEPVLSEHPPTATPTAAHTATTLDRRTERVIDLSVG
jgi:hypothetical protein